MATVRRGHWVFGQINIPIHFRTGSGREANGRRSSHITAPRKWITTTVRCALVPFRISRTYWKRAAMRSEVSWVGDAQFLVSMLKSNDTSRKQRRSYIVSTSRRFSCMTQIYSVDASAYLGLHSRRCLISLRCTRRNLSIGIGAEGSYFVLSLR